MPDRALRQIDLRIEIQDGLPDVTPAQEEQIVHTTVADNGWIKGVVILRNNGFGHLLPDESTRQER